jgi:WD40 repeat protein
VEKSENRYVLVGCGDGQLLLYDHVGLEDHPKPLVRVERNAALHHDRGICLADWYCNDNGIFNVGSFDGSVGVWDTNKFACAHKYKVSDCVNTIACGVFEETSPLIAVGTKSDQLRLLDIRQEANTHTLVGHREQVNALAWSNVSPFTLISGDIEGTMFVWDLRKPVPVAEVGSKEQPKIIGALARSESDGISKMNNFGGGKRLKTSGFQMDRRVDEVVQKSFGVIKKNAASPSAHTGSVNALMFSPKGKYLFSFSNVCSDSSHQLKVWDVEKYELVCSSNFERIRNYHPFMRLDMCMNEELYDKNQRLFFCVNSKMFSYYPEKEAGITHWPSAHARGVVG